MSFRPDDAWEEPLLSVLRRWAAAIVVFFALIVLSLFPFRIGSFGEIRPSFMIMAIYYWAIMRPAAFSPLAAFGAGAAFDLLAGFPFGLNALTLVLVQWVARAQRRFLLGQPFLVMWAGLSIVAAGAMALQWALMSLFSWTLMPYEGALMGALVTAALFPLAVVPLSALNNVIGGDRRG